MLQHLADGRVDLMLGRGNTGPVYPWFGKDIRDGIPWQSRTITCCTGCARGSCGLGGQVPYPAQSFTSTPVPLDGIPPFWHGRFARRSQSRPRKAGMASSPTTSSGRRSTSSV